jgi:hypothetical protein
VWDEFYSLRRPLGARSVHVDLTSAIGHHANLEALPEDDANMGITVGSARVSRANRWARLIAKRVGACSSRAHYLRSPEWPQVRDQVGFMAAVR